MYNVECMEKMERKNRNKWFGLLLVLLLMPCLIFFGCGGSSNTGSSGTDSNVYTVVFYTGIGTEFNVPRQEVADGNVVRKPVGFPTRYYDEQTDTTKQFIGWYTDPSFEDKYLWKFETDEVHSNLTLYAYWEPIHIKA